MPFNLYGPDNSAPETRHVTPALIRKCEEARIRGDKEIVCWGTGKATREFLYADDAAEGVIRAAERIEEPIPNNLGGSEEIAIADLVKLITDTCGFTGAIRWDATNPKGEPRRAIEHQSRECCLTGSTPPHSRMDSHQRLTGTATTRKPQRLPPPEQLSPSSSVTVGTERPAVAANHYLSPNSTAEPC